MHATGDQDRKEDRGELSNPSSSSGSPRWRKTSLEDGKTTSGSPLSALQGNAKFSEKSISHPWLTNGGPRPGSPSSLLAALFVQVRDRHSILISRPAPLSLSFFYRYPFRSIRVSPFFLSPLPLSFLSLVSHTPISSFLFDFPPAPSLTSLFWRSESPPVAQCVLPPHRKPSSFSRKRMNRERSSLW